MSKGYSLFIHVFTGQQAVQGGSDDLFLLLRGADPEAFHDVQ